jgi:hypothetical protein
VSNIELVEETPLIEKIMGHFGWYKVKKVELPIENLEITHTFVMKDNKPELPKAPVKKPAAKRPRRRTPRSDFKFGKDTKNGN